MKRIIGACGAALVLFSSCAFRPGEIADRVTEEVYEMLTYGTADQFGAEPYGTADLADELNIEFRDLLTPEPSPAAETDFPEPADGEADAGNGGALPNGPSERESFPMRVYGSMTLYDAIGGAQKSALTDGEEILLRELEGGWAEISDRSGRKLGYAKDGFEHALGENSAVYAVLPVEYGMAKTNQETYVLAYSHLVDIRRYFNTAECRDEEFSSLDLDGVDFVISMKLSTDGTSIGEPFYHRNLCLLQYDLLPMMRKAAERFREDGCTIVIYDAYRPTSVQQRWFDVIRVHKWVADPSIGMGGVHDRGTAVDISLIDRNGNLLEMPTPMHTFTEESARNSPSMTQTARDNMNYMLSVMLDCGFTYINSEWWHFQDVNTKYYLPTDHPLDEVPLAVMERGR